MTPSEAATEFWSLNELAKIHDKSLNSRITKLGKIQSRFSPQQWGEYSERIRE